MNSNRVCCIRLSIDMGHIYLFNVYLPCDTTNHENLCEYNMILTDIAKYCAENDASNCIIGGDMNTDLSRVKSGNTISLHKFISEENLSFVLKDRPNSVDYTYKGMNNNVSLIDHFIVSENICSRIEGYYSQDSIDNLSDHIPLFFELKCTVQTVTSEHPPVMQSKPIWGLAQPHHIQKCQAQLSSQLYKFLPTNKMFVEADSLCLKREFITTFHDNINTASHVAMEQHIPYSYHPKAKVIPGWDIGMDIARDKSMFWYGIWRNCGRLQSGVVYSIMKKTRSTYHYMLRSLKKKKHSKTMLQIKNRNYWKTARVERKNKFNCTNVVDGVKGDSQIANLFTQRQKLSVINLKHVEKLSVCTVISLVVLMSQLQ